MLAVGAAEAMPPARETFDATGLHLLPGAIDDHVHFRDPGYPHKEDWASGTRGGRVRRRHHSVRYAQHRSRRPARPRFSRPSTRSPPPRRTSISGFTDCSAKTPSPTFQRWSKAASSASSSIWAIPSARSPRPPPARCWKRSRSVAPTGKRISLHAETNSIMERRQKRLMAARAESIRCAHLAARPAVVAVEAVSRAAILAEWTGARIHILHISSAEELRPLREAKARGVDITGETCPHYLLLSTDDYHRVRRASSRVNPPVREARNREPIWAALARRHHRHDRHRPRAAYAGREDPQRHLDRRLRFSRRRDADAADADRGQRRPHVDLRLCAQERLQPGQHLGSLSAQGRAHARRRSRYRHRRSRARLAHDRRCGAAIALENLPVERPPRARFAAPHAGARPLRHEGPRACRRHPGMGPFRAHDPGHAAPGSTQCRNDACRRSRRADAWTRKDDAA